MTGRRRDLGVALKDRERRVLASVMAAGRLLMSEQKAIAADATRSQLKSDGTLVTDADLASERLILAAIETAEGNARYRVVNEERTSIITADGAAATWFVDPLDGTGAYGAGSPDFAVLVSRWVDLEPDFSIALYPRMNAIMVAHGSDVDVDGSPVASPMALDTLCVCYADPATKAMVAQSDVATNVEFGMESTSALFELAARRVGAVLIQVGSLHSWDVAPFLHAVCAAGVHLCDENGSRVRPYGASLDVEFLVGAQDEVLLERLRRVISPREDTSDVPELKK